MICDDCKQRLEPGIFASFYPKWPWIQTKAFPPAIVIIERVKQLCMVCYESHVRQPEGNIFLSSNRGKQK